MSDFWDEYGGIILFVVIGAFVIFCLVALFKAAVNDQNKWDSFKQTHDCKVVSETAGHWVYGFGGKNSNSYYVNGQTTWKCNDGVTYTRDN